jgi:hypothetical protein
MLAYPGTVCLCLLALGELFSLMLANARENLNCSSNSSPCLLAILQSLPGPGTSTAQTQRPPNGDFLTP